MYFSLLPLCRRPFSCCARDGLSSVMKMSQYWQRYLGLVQCQQLYTRTSYRGGAWAQGSKVAAAIATHLDFQYSVILP